jgi:hypothetical protein
MQLQCLQNIEGNPLADMMLSLIAYPLVAVQLHDEGEAAQIDRERKYVPPHGA